ncbi:hypothetical protein ACSWZG_007158, partial [Pseudomonas aeruginosa]
EKGIEEIGVAVARLALGGAAHRVRVVHTVRAFRPRSAVSGRPLPRGRHRVGRLSSFACLIAGRRRGDAFCC